MQVPRRLQKKIRTFYEYLWESGQDNHSTGLFQEMPEKLKLQLNIALKRRLIEKVSKHLLLFQLLLRSITYVLDSTVERFPMMGTRDASPNLYNRRE